MLRGLLRDSDAEKSLFEKTGLFKTPELLEKYVIASEVTVEVLDLFLSRVFGTERASFGNGSVDLKTLWESLSAVSLNEWKDEVGEDSSARADESNKEVEELRVKVQDMERQLCALQRQLQMQGEMSQLAVALGGRLDEIACECERQVYDVRSQVSAVSEDVVHLKSDVSERASIEDLRDLREEVSRLKDGELCLEERILGRKDKTTEIERVLRDELQGEIKRIDALMKMIIDPLNPGIIAHLTRECGGNVHEKGVVEVAASGCHGDDWEAKNAVELGTDTRFSCKKEPNSWIQYDFKERCVVPTSYSIRSGGGAFPKSWVFEVSKNGSEGSWKVIDCRENNEDLTVKFVTRNFAISPPPNERCRFVRLRQTGRNHNDTDFLILSSLEIFGTLSPQ